mgnify:CR=1 FL=1
MKCWESFNLIWRSAFLVKLDLRREWQTSVTRRGSQISTTFLRASLPWRMCVWSETTGETRKVELRKQHIINTYKQVWRTWLSTTRLLCSRRSLRARSRSWDATSAWTRHFPRKSTRRWWRRRCRTPSSDRPTMTASSSASPRSGARSTSGTSTSTPARKTSPSCSTNAARSCKSSSQKSTTW